MSTTIDVPDDFIPRVMIAMDTNLAEFVINGSVRGALIHDARIAACCVVGGIGELWTVDRDFSHFPALKTRNPLGG